MSDVIWMDPDDPMDADEYDRAWDAIADNFGDYECRCPWTNEVWQYMGTYLGTLTEQIAWHQFRHRAMPNPNDPGRTGERVVWNVKADTRWLLRKQGHTLVEASETGHIKAALS